MDVTTSVADATAASQRAKDAELNKVDKGHREIEVLRVSTWLEQDTTNTEELCRCREKARADFNGERQSVEVKSGHNIVAINARGKIFKTLQATLCVVSDSVLAKMFSGRWDQGLERDANGAIFLDVSPKAFEIILSWLRAKALNPKVKLPVFPTDVCDEAKAFMHYMMSSEAGQFDKYKVYYRYATAVPEYNTAVTLFVVRKQEPSRCTVEEFEEFATSKGLRIPNAKTPGAGKGYSSACQHSDIYGYRVLADFWNVIVLANFPDATYTNALVMHGNSAHCFAHNAEPGSLHALGDLSGAHGYSFCRGGDAASKQYHIYVCCGVYRPRTSTAVPS